ncbi:hypothetical protein LAZ67_8003523 [Cordylochernes scorpioides]|uniref:Transposase n=1 Tax=Cordylochernes scorpioides TaxID=51811 RepID=A0ABY6KRL0_9ARAC|nr:hypothetical protein LAZ67_8003523 [Cordylochernes scorpioides]
MMSDPNLEYLAFYKRQLDKKSLQLARWRCQLAFNLKCSQASFIPPSLRIRDPVQNHYSAAIIHRTEEQLLNSRIRGSRAMIRFLQKTIRGLLCLLSPRIPSNDLGSLVQGITARVKLQNSEIELRHQRKLEFWHVKYGFPLRTRSPSEDVIVNLTDIVFSDKQISLLEKGLSFQLPNEPDLLYTISCIESSLQHQSHTDKHHIRSTIANKLLAAYKSSSSRSSSVKSDLASLKALKSHHDILITKSDKGSQVVVLKVDDYKKKMSDILSDSDTFQEISPERVCAISDAYKSSLRLLRRNECITPDQFQQFTSNLSRVPYIYGLSKTHKPSVPLRPIVVYHLSPALPLAKYLSSLLKPLVKTHNLYSVQDPSEFFTRLKNVSQPRGLTMSTFDVTSLFLCLPHSLIIDGLEQLLSSSTLPSNKQKTILDLFTICLDMNALEFNGCFFVQMRGSPMGSPLSTIAAEIVMSNLDRWLVSHNHLGIEMWSRLIFRDWTICRTVSSNSNKRFGHDPDVFKIFPRILTEEQKEVRMDVCKNMVKMTRPDPEWMQKIITGDETWVYQYDTETKRQSSQWIERGEPKPKKARFTKSKVNTLLVTFFCINGLVHHEFIPFGRTINQEVYLGIMRRLRESVRLKRPERWQNNEWILHVDNARPHTAHVVLQFLAKHSTIQIPHPPYSPDLAPNDFFLYPKLKMKLKGRKFDNVDMIQTESKATLRNLSKSDFISCFDNWKKRWNRCIEAGGAYFEKY